MTNRTYCMPTAIRSALSMLVLCGLGSAVSAQEYCVTCTEPDAKYRCILSGPPSPQAASSRGQLLCITELARSGNHASCAVGATNTGPCKGDLKTVMFPAVPDPSIPPIAEAPAETEAPAAQDLPPVATDAASEPQAPQQGAPKTVEELAKKTVKSSGESLKKAGHAVGGAVKKTWGCLSSFFTNC